MAGFVFALITVVVVGWRRPRLGGVIGLFAGAAMAVFVALTTTGRGLIVAICVSVVPALVAGVAFFLSARTRPPAFDA